MMDQHMSIYGLVDSSLENQDHSFPVIPTDFNFKRRPSWETESNAFLKSMYITSTSTWSDLASRNFSVNSNNCCRADLPRRKPYWYFVND